MEIGLGVLGYSPEAFWSLTYQEFTAAIDGVLEKNGARKTPGMTPEEAEQLKRQLGVTDGEKVPPEIKALFKKNHADRARQTNLPT